MGLVIIILRLQLFLAFRLTAWYNQSATQLHIGQRTKGDFYHLGKNTSSLFASFVSCRYCVATGGGYIFFAHGSGLSDHALF